MNKYVVDIKPYEQIDTDKVLKLVAYNKSFTCMDLRLAIHSIKNPNKNFDKRNIKKSIYKNDLNLLWGHFYETIQNFKNLKAQILKLFGHKYRIFAIDNKRYQKVKEYSHYRIDNVCLKEQELVRQMLQVYHKIQIIIIIFWFQDFYNIE